jgi:hypothetical protein
VLYAKTKENFLVVLDKNLEYVKKENYKKLWSKIGNIEQFNLIKNDKEIVVINKNEIVAEFNNVDEAFVNGSYLFILNKLQNRITRINFDKNN